MCFLLGTLPLLDRSGPIECLMTAVCFNEPEPSSNAHSHVVLILLYKNKLIIVFFSLSPSIWPNLGHLRCIMCDADSIIHTLTNVNSQAILYKALHINTHTHTNAHKHTAERQFSSPSLKWTSVFCHT